MTRRPPPQHPRRGVALLLAMLLMTLVATLAAGVVWQQWRAVEVEAAERDREQSALILGGALDWARLILREDSRGADHLGEPWAIPLAEARLSTFLAADHSAEDAPDAFMSGAITDAQARFNLRNLVANGHVDPAQLAILQRLCESTGIAAEIAPRIADGLVAAWNLGGADAPLPPGRIADLVWLGLSRDETERLDEVATILPVATPVNVNTAPRAVLEAVLDKLDGSTVAALIEQRNAHPFLTMAAFQAALPPGTPAQSGRVDVRSDHFVIRGRVRIGDHAVGASSLVERRGLEIVPLDRELSAAIVPGAE